MASINPDNLEGSSDDFSMTASQSYVKAVVSSPYQGYARYYNSEKLSDVTIRYGANGQHTFYGHKILLATQSKFFENLFTKAPRDTTEFSFKGDHPKTFKLMLKFAYGRELNYPTTGPLLDTVLFAIEMYRTATKYEFPEFEQVAVASFTVWMKKLCSGSSVESEGPTLHELFTVVVKVYAVPSNAHLRDGLIYVVTTTPQTCKFRTYKTFTFCVKAAADSEPGFEKDLR